jgi:hypothetical protein
MNGEIRMRRFLDSKGNWVLTNVYFIDNIEVTKQQFDDKFKDRKMEIDRTAEGKSNKRAWPIKSEGAAVHPKQRNEAIAHAKKIGIPTYFDRVGRPVFTSQAHQTKYLKAIGMFNKDGNSGGQSRTYRAPEQPIHPEL